MLESKLTIAEETENRSSLKRIVPTLRLPFFDKSE